MATAAQHVETAEVDKPVMLAPGLFAVTYLATFT
jgi:hypothetical protein